MACGPGKIGDWLIPDFNETSCCSAHDVAYKKGDGTEKLRSGADTELYRCIRRERPTNALVAIVFYTVTRLTGWLFYKYK